MSHFGEFLFHIPKPGDFNDKRLKPMINCLLVDDNCNDVAVAGHKFTTGRANSRITYNTLVSLGDFNFKAYKKSWKFHNGNWCQWNKIVYTKPLMYKACEIENRMLTPKMYERHVRGRVPVVVINWLRTDFAKVSLCVPVEMASLWWELVYNSKYFNYGDGDLAMFPIASHNLNNMIVVGGVVMNLEKFLETANLGIRFKIDYSMVDNDCKEFWQPYYKEAETQFERMSSEVFLESKYTKQQLTNLFNLIDNFNMR